MKNTKGKTVKHFYRATLKLSTVNEDFPSQAQIFNSRDCAELCRNFWDTDTIEILESFGVCYVNKANKPVCWVELSKGGIDGTVVDMRLLFSHALLSNATGFILCHNHPSGNTQPSQADQDITRRIVQAAKIMNMVVLDHLILTVDSYYSFADQGML